MTPPSVNRRQLLQAMGATGAMGILAPWVSASAQATADKAAARVLFGLPPGAVGTRLASGFVAQLAAQQGSSYKLEHVLGRDGRRSVEAAIRAQPDGNTLLIAPSALVTLFSAIYRQLEYAPNTDLTPIAGIGEYAFMFLVGPRVPADVATLDDYLRWVLDNPDFRHVGAVLRGSQGWLMTKQLAREKDAPLLAISYAATASILADLEGGNLAAGFVTTGNGANARAAGRLRALAVSSAHSWVGMPDTPSFTELGLSDMEVTAWYGLFGPARMREEALQALQRASSQALEAPAMTGLMDQVAMLPLPLNPQEMAKRIRRESAFYEAAVRRVQLERI